jgi:hypothetical protein
MYSTYVRLKPVRSEAHKISWVNWEQKWDRSVLHRQMHGEGGIGGIDISGYAMPVAEATMRI